LSFHDVASKELYIQKLQDLDPLISPEVKNEILRFYHVENGTF
jgi:hypothetical protein